MLRASRKACGPLQREDMESGVRMVWDSSGKHWMLRRCLGC